MVYSYEDFAKGLTTLQKSVERVTRDLFNKRTNKRILVDRVKLRAKQDNKEIVRMKIWEDAEFTYCEAFYTDIVNLEDEYDKQYNYDSYYENY